MFVSGPIMSWRAVSRQNYCAVQYDLLNPDHPRGGSQIGNDHPIFAVLTF